MRSLVVLSILTLVVGDVCADIPPPPPPKGKKYIDVSNSVAVDRNVKGYVFVTQTFTGPGRPVVSHLRVVLSEKPTKMPEGGRRKSVSLIALPEVEVQKFKDESAIDEAIQKGTISGMHRLGFSSTDTVSAEYPNKTMSVEYTITEIDAKKGIIKTIKRDGKTVDDAKTKDRRGDDGDRPSDDETDGLDRASTRWPIAGAFASVALVMLGVWFVRRRTI